MCITGPQNEADAPERQLLAVLALRRLSTRRRNGKTVTISRASLAARTAVTRARCYDNPDGLTPQTRAFFKWTIGAAGWGGRSTVRPCSNRKRDSGA
jgi:hypothetical protein